MNAEQQDMPARGRWARRAATVLVGGAIAAGGLAALAVPAHAAPTGCTVQYQYPGAKATCTEGDGLYRARATCLSMRMVGQRLVWSEYTRYGSWVAPGPDSASLADCLPGSAKAIGIEYA
ncbi:hypothetical protein SAMN04489712_115127 [Thermomonospora echinospora]|uniref:Alpha amylase inhibitor n=1 Tax=Thermomonospora echinospora TaxID=1992 RepID=A0A1H6DCI2_9ACTN|nr:hypothetical protein [Thermomonospora echinospora]SEG83031.1 hypothetical protein SAMN04489712_115127 [Thermomonospora echinospora]